MNIYARNKLKEKDEYLRYLRENSHYYKLLNRDPHKVDDMIDEMKERYGKRFKDKMENVSNIIDVLSLLKDN